MLADSARHAYQRCSTRDQEALALNGPQMGQLVVYTNTPSNFYPAIIINPVNVS
jgi:hypothetical protein